MSQHEAPITIRNGPARHRRRVVIGGAVAVVLLVAGVAVAALLARAPITGGGSAGSVSLGWAPNPAPTVAKTGSVNVTAGLETPNSGAPLRIDFTNALPGDTFTVTGTVIVNSSAVLTVNAPKFVNSADVVTTFDTGSELTTGATIPTGQRSYIVKIKVTFAATLAPGTSLPAAADAGVTASTA